MPYLVASVWAARATFVKRVYKCLTDDDVFNIEVLRDSDTPMMDDGQKAQTKDDGARGRAFYRRFIIIQHWKIYREHFDIHENKAKKIKFGQCFFIAFLVVLLLIGCALSYSAFAKYKATESTPASPSVKP